MGKICLINPPTSAGVRDLYFPLGLVTLGTVLQEHGFPVEIVDFELELRKDASLSQLSSFKDFAIQRLKRTQADFFGISSICSNFPVAILLAQEIRRLWPSSPIVLGGPQPSAIPDDTLRACPWIDAVVIGEGERTLLELALSDFQKESLRKIPGMAFRKGDQVFRTGHRELISDLDEIPIPDFSLVPLRDYLTLAPGFDLIEAGRGCPFLCSFCSTALMWERKFRVKSPARILEEMRRLSRKYGLIVSPLTHDNFTTSHSWVARFCEFFKQNNDEKFGWSVTARSDTLNPERLRLLRDAGCVGLFFGVDSGSPRIQRIIKKNLNLDQFREHLTIAVSLGLKCVTSFVIGFPDESPEDLEETIRLGLWAKFAGANVVAFHPLAPLAGTAVYEENRSRLFFDSKRMSDCALQPFNYAEIVTLVASHPRLFSSYYTVPTPHLDPLNVAIVGYFFQEIVNVMPVLFQELMTSTGWSPLEVFVRWMNWMVDRYGVRKIDGPFIYNTFPEFIRANRADDLSLPASQVEPQRASEPGAIEF